MGGNELEILNCTGRVARATGLSISYPPQARKQLSHGERVDGVRGLSDGLRVIAREGLEVGAGDRWAWGFHGWDWKFFLGKS